MANLRKNWLRIELVWKQKNLDFWKARSFWVLWNLGAFEGQVCNAVSNLLLFLV